MSEQAKPCPREGCTYHETGRCLEGFTPEECPYLTAEETAERGEADNEGRTLERESIFKGEALRLEEANALTRRTRCKLIVLAGAVRSGKTTLITTIYEEFSKAPFAGLSFAGSQTLRGFERRCLLGRAESGGTLPATPRTTSKTAKALHLTVAESERRSLTNLLFVDVSGEQYKIARDRSAGVRALTFLSRADHLALLIDGGRLQDRTKRAVAFNNARALLRSIIQQEALSDTCSVDVVFSKWDLVRSSPLREETDDFVLSIQSQMHDEFAKHGVQLAFASIAAQPTSKSLPFAHGVASLAKRWVHGKPNPAPGPILWCTPDTKGKRQSACFAQRYFKRAGVPSDEYRRA